MSNIYKPSIHPDEIYHWKYKDKYRKDGHWVYVYDDGSSSEGTLSYNKVETKYQVDDKGNRVKIDRYAITDSKRLFDGKTTKSPLFYSEKGHTKNTRQESYQTEYKTYGRLHMHKMNLERKISDIVSSPGRAAKKVKESLFHNPLQPSNILPFDKNDKPSKATTNKPASSSSGPTKPNKPASSSSGPNIKESMKQKKKRWWMR